MAHTPGPWIAAPPSSVVGAPIVASPSGRSIGHVTYGPKEPAFERFNDESAANAALIAAAPDLLAALKGILAWEENIEPMTEQQSANRFRAARYAILKAEGRDG